MTFNPFPEVGHMQKIPNLAIGVYAYGFERPSAIQQRAIMPIIKGECFRLYYSPIKNTCAESLLYR